MRVRDYKCYSAVSELYLGHSVAAVLELVVGDDLKAGRPRDPAFGGDTSSGMLFKHMSHRDLHPEEGGLQSQFRSFLRTSPQ